MNKMTAIAQKALAEENVMGFEGLAVFAHASDVARKKKLIGDEPHEMRALHTKYEGKEYGVCLFNDPPEDVWVIIQVTPKHDAYIGATYKMKYVGHMTNMSESLENT